jgi:DNA-binding transcriptional regulator YiaG
MTGEEIRNLRKILGVSQNQFARLLHMGEGGDVEICRWESGRNSPRNPYKKRLDEIVEYLKEKNLVDSNR